ncbi:MAG: HAMP domain-containing sensor histidine kinase [Bacillus sp. (in: firmicutes)]
MDTKWRNYSHSMIAKIIVFILVVFCFTGAIKAFVKGEAQTDGAFNSVTEESYLESQSFIQESENLIGDLTRLLDEYKNEEHILNGGSVSEDELSAIEQSLFYDSFQTSSSYNPNLSEEENVQKFKKEYADQIQQAKDQAIKDDLKDYHQILQNIEEYKEPLFYASDGTNVFSNTTMSDKEQFAKYPAYLLFEDYRSEFYPKKWKQSGYVYRITDHIETLDPENSVVYVAFTKPFLDSNIQEWEENKSTATNYLYQLIGHLLGLILSFLYLILLIGRKSFKDQEVHLQFVDKLYTDINILLCIGLMTFWIALVDDLFEHLNQLIILITFPIATAGLVLVLSLFKHLKNRTFFKHSLIYRILYHIVVFIKSVYDSGSIGIKTVLIVIGYPLLIAVTFFMFPITIGVAAWFAFKKVQSFRAIQEGVDKIKAGNLHHRIEVAGKGEFSKLASNINSISEGLEKAVEGELKSERLKTELITNVSHDIRTPLTSIITYVDLLKNERDPEKIDEYVGILDQKSQRLKVLTDDLFDAAKASSGSMPVHLEEIDIESLLTQGLGEVNDKIQASELEFKIRQPEDKIFIKADGKLLWRSIENLLSNIFNYAMQGSRVYIDIEDIGNEVLITFKNISAFELNITEDELMERFTRGDESRTSQGSGLGLSIAKSLIELQKGRFTIQIDGDLFKAMIYMPK